MGDIWDLTNMDRALADHEWDVWTKVGASEDGCPVLVSLCTVEGCPAEQEFRHVDCPAE